MKDGGSTGNINREHTARDTTIVALKNNAVVAVQHIAIVFPEIRGKPMQCTHHGAKLGKGAKRNNAWVMA
ncbi:MAG: hypothetical protein HYS20_10350 [Rhodocyclales bacterium]|nr:hypothetical protein [Rhodocyclales bacterium]